MRSIILAAVGIVSSLATVVIAITFGDTFGYPGSAAYIKYESFNRTVSVLLVVQWFGVIGFALKYLPGAKPLFRLSTYLLLIAWPLMSIATAAEFWFFSDLPYAEDNMRSLAFSIFSFSSLIAGLGMVVLGISLLRAKKMSTVFAILCFFYLPFDVVLFIGGQSIFLAPACGALLLALPALKLHAQRH